MMNYLGNWKVLINTVQASVFSCLIYVRGFNPHCLHRPTFTHTHAEEKEPARARNHACTGRCTHKHTHTHPGSGERRFSSYKRSQRLLSLRSDAEYLTINYSWISEALILEPLTWQLWIRHPPFPSKPSVCVCVCVHI